MKDLNKALKKIKTLELKVAKLTEEIKFKDWLIIERQKDFDKFYSYTDKKEQIVNWLQSDMREVTRFTLETCRLIEKIDEKLNST